MQISFGAAPPYFFGLAPPRPAPPRPVKKIASPSIPDISVWTTSTRNGQRRVVGDSKEAAVEDSKEAGQPRQRRPCQWWQKQWAVR